MKWDRDKIKKLAGFFYEGLSRIEIAKKMEVSYSSLNSFLGKTGWIRKSKKKGRKKMFIEKEVLREQAKIIRRNTLYEVIGEELSRATKAIPVPSVPRTKINFGQKQDEEEMGLMFSDSHIGQLVDQRESGGLGSYHIQIFKEEMLFLRKSLQKIFEIHFSNTPYNVINIFGLGDIIEGRILRPAQLRLTDLNIAEQIMMAVDEISKLLAWLSRIFPQVNFYGVVGQHGRFDRDMSMNAPQDNMDYIVYHWIKDRLRNLKNIKMNISDSWWMIVERMSVKFYMEHGEEFFSWLGIPFYGLKRGKANIRELMRQYLDEKGRQVDFDYFLTAHIHQTSEFNDILTNGAFPGGSEYSLKRLKLGGQPKQKLFSIHPTFKITWKRDILLRDPTKKQRVKFYS